MKLRQLKRKPLLWACGLCSAVLLGLIVFALPRSSNAEPPQRREYPVQKGNIVVGIDAPGTIASERYHQFLSLPLQIKEYRVKAGDFVREGEVLAELSPEDIETKLKAASTKLKDDSFALEKLKTEKNNNQLALAKKLDDLRAAGESAYQDKAGMLLSKKAAAEQGIAGKKALLAQGKASLSGDQTEKDTRAEKIAVQEAAIKQLQAENTVLQQQIDAFLADTGTDHTAEIAQLTQKKIGNELAVSDKAREKKRLETTDYDALIAAANAQITQLEAELAALNAELSAVNGSLQAVDEQRSRDRAKEDESISLLVKQEQAQHAILDNQISGAQSTCADSKKARDALLAFQKSPQIFAEQDGTVIKLGYAPNATTEVITPVVTLGTDERKTVLLQVDPMDIADVALGQEVSFYVDAYADATFYGKVEAKSYLQNDSGKFDVTVSFDQTEQTLLEGMGANATLIVKQKLNVLTLSSKAIFRKDKKSCVYLADENGVLSPKEITTGFSNGRMTEITGGLADGDTVWTEEQYEDS
ncbi:MAG: hypothetical protein RSG59_01765 [Ruthenibacterium sp.]